MPNSSVETHPSCPFRCFRGAFDLRVGFHTTARCDRAAVLPCAERLDGRTLRVCGRGMAEMRRWANVLIGLA